MLQKYQKEQENTKLMLLPRNIIKVFLTLGLLLTSHTEVNAGLYGFHQYNPYTKEERILDLKEVPLEIQNYRAYMRENLLMLIRYAKEKNPDFKIITHEGQDLITKSLWEYDLEGYNRARVQENAEDDSFLFHSNYREQEPQRYTPAHEYLHLIDAIAINNLYCKNGHESKVTQNHNIGLITIEECPSQTAIDEMQISAMINKKIAYGFTDANDAFNSTKNHNSINDSSKNIFQISDAQNILILLDDSKYSNKEHMVDELLKTNYDIIIIPPLFQHSIRFSDDDIRKLQFKKNGSKRLLIAAMNVSEASPSDYFWLKDWKVGLPEWLKRKSFTSKDNVITQFWHPEWKKIISNYFKDIMNEGFDGIFFTGVENYQYFEQQNPLE